jgi:hypothetical protein
VNIIMSYVTNWLTTIHIKLTEITTTEKIYGLFFLFLFGEDLAFVSLLGMNWKGKERQRQNVNLISYDWRLGIEETNFIATNKAFYIIN